MSPKLNPNCYGFATRCRKLYFCFVGCRKPKKVGNQCFRGISRLGSASFFLRCFKLAHICIQVTSLHSNKQGINHRFLSLAYFTWGVKLREVFCSCVSAIYSRGKRLATWSSRCALKSLCRHAYYIGGVCLLFCNTDKKTQM